jgi:DnaJ-class molecular chaperone
MNNYEILGVSRNANSDEIKKQYRKLSMKYHPDRNSDPGATKKFQEINEAFTALSNPVNIFANNNMFDKTAMNANNAADDLINTFFKHIAEDINMQMFTTSLDNEDMFNNINNFSMPMPMHMPNIFSKLKPNLNSKVQSSNLKNKYNNEINIEPIIKDLSITLDQSYTGDNIPIKIERYINENNRTRLENETIYINIQKGIDNDEIIYIKEKGNIINDKKGDLNIIIKITNETDFKRDGLNLLITKNVNFKDTFCGFNFSINHINGKLYKLNNKSGNIIKPDSNKVIPKLGMIREDNIGNLIIKFHIIYPEKITDEQIEIIRKYF